MMAGRMNPIGAFTKDGSLNFVQAEIGDCQIEGCSEKATNHCTKPDGVSYRHNDGHCLNSKFESCDKLICPKHTKAFYMRNQHRMIGRLTLCPDCNKKRLRPRTVRCSILWSIILVVVIVLLVFFVQFIKRRRQEHREFSCRRGWTQYC